MDAAREALVNGAAPGAIPTEGLPPDGARLIRAATTLNALSPFGHAASLAAGPGQDHPLDAALRRYDFEAAQAQLDALNGTPAELWQVASRFGLENVMKALLAVQPEAFVRELARTPPNFFFYTDSTLPLNTRVSALHAGLHAARFSAELIRFLEAIPHFPARAPAMLNDRNNGFVCRHLSMALLRWLEADTTRPVGGEIDFTPFETAEAVRAHFNADALDEQQLAWQTGARETYLVANAQFGRFAADRLAALAPGEVQRFLLNSHNHTMALELSRTVGTDERVYTARFYDPNWTNVDARAIIGDPSLALDWTLSDFIAAEYLEHAYFDRENPLGTYHALTAGPIPAPEAGRRLTQSYAGDPIASPGALYEMLTNGFPGELQALPERVSAMSPDDAWAMLSYEPGKPVGICRAVSYGYVEAARIFGHAMREAPLSYAQRSQLLAKAVPGASTSDAANVASVEAFAALLDACGADAGQRAEVLAGFWAPDPDDRRGCLYWPLWNGHVQAVRAFGSVITPDLPAPVLTRVLMAPDQTGQNFALGTLGYSGGGEAVRALAALLRPVQHVLSAEDKLRIVAPPTTPWPPLVAASVQNHADFVRAYGELLRAAALPVDALQAVLAQPHTPAQAPHSNAVTTALQFKQPEVLEAFATVLEDSLPSAARRELVERMLSPPYLHYLLGLISTADVPADDVRARMGRDFAARFGVDWDAMVARHGSDSA